MAYAYCLHFNSDVSEKLVLITWKYIFGQMRPSSVPSKQKHKKVIVTKQKQKNWLAWVLQVQINPGFTFVFSNPCQFRQDNSRQIQSYWTQMFEYLLSLILSKCCRDLPKFLCVTCHLHPTSPHLQFWRDKPAFLAYNVSIISTTNQNLKFHLGVFWVEKSPIMFINLVNLIHIPKEPTSQLFEGLHITKTAQI